MRVLPILCVGLCFACTTKADQSEKDPTRDLSTDRDPTDDGDPSDEDPSEEEDDEQGESDPPVDDEDDEDDTEEEGESEEGGTETEDCPDGVICVDSFPFTDTATTTGVPTDDFDSYGCAPSTDESGPEVVYRVDLDEDGFLALDLPMVGTAVDVDVHILGSLDPDDCIDRGHHSAGALLDAGRYWVVVDTWVDSGGTEFNGDYTVSFGHTSAIDLEVEGMERDVAADALGAYARAWGWGETDSFVYAITDFSLYSAEPRMWIIDFAAGDLLWNLHVTHGENSSDPSDRGWAVDFSNINESHQSSLGMMRGAESYIGTWGDAMRIDGLEPGYNDNVRSRAIVMHGADYATAEYADAYGRAGQSWGCPAIDYREVVDVIDVLYDGALLFFWYPDGDWSEYSDYLR